MKYVTALLVLLLLLIGCGPEFDDSAEYSDTNLADLCSNQFDVSQTERPATFEPKGHYAIMRGLIGSSTPDRMAELLDEYPEVEILVIAYSPGSEDDTANLEASLMLHEAQIDTCVPPGGEINSGGVDLFLAGDDRWLADDSWVGVHSWGADGYGGSDLERDHPEHQPYLDYYRQIGIDEAFYWYTLDAAGADDIHNMSSAEREQYGMARE